MMAIRHDALARDMEGDFAVQLADEGTMLHQFEAKTAFFFCTNRMRRAVSLAQSGTSDETAAAGSGLRIITGLPLLKIAA